MPRVRVAAELVLPAEQCRAILEDASRRILSAWADELGEAVDVAETETTMAWLVRTIAETLASTPDLPPGGPAANVLGRRLLDLLRAELVQTWSTPGEVVSPSSATILSILSAIDRVQAALQPDWSQYFTSRLSGPGGLDLVIEVAHDLRSPLTSILFLAENIERGRSGPVNELQTRQLRLIYSAALGLSSMASDVIELARGGEHLLEAEISPFSVSEVLEGVTDLVRPMAEEKKLTVRYESLPTDRRMGRPLALSRVLLNLTSNAIKFTDEGSVVIGTHATGMSQVEFSVTDTGHGISKATVASLYQPFRRSRARADRSGFYFSGTGLGLAMCRKLVGAMGGELLFDTRAGEGTRFHFEIDLPSATSWQP